MPFSIFVRIEDGTVIAILPRTPRHRTRLVAIRPTHPRQLQFICGNFPDRRHHAEHVPVPGRAGVGVSGGVLVLGGVEIFVRSNGRSRRDLDPRVGSSGTDGEIIDHALKRFCIMPSIAWDATDE